MPKEDQRNGCLILAIRTGGKPEGQRIKAIGLLLNESAAFSRQALADMDTVIRDFVAETSRLYTRHVQINKDFKTYRETLTRYIKGKYPWVSEENVAHLYGTFSYR